MIVAAIDRDFITKGEFPTRVGKIFEIEEAIEAPKTRFRCKDDDGITYYGGWLFNDLDCIVQMGVLSWCQADAGCTTIEIKDDNGYWRQEIG